MEHVLGRVDGFDRDDCEDEGEERSEVDSCFLASKGDALEALDLADGDFDTRSSGIEDFRKERRLLFDVGAIGDGRTHAASASGLAIGLRVVSFVGERGARIDVGSDIQQGRESGVVAGLAARQQERDR